MQAPETAQPADPAAVVAAARAALASCGLDIVEPLALEWYNTCLPPEASASAIPPQGPAGSAALVLLIGNSAAVWRPFVAACAADPSLLASPHPLETYIERCIDSSLVPMLAPLGPQRLFQSHSQAALAGGRGFVAMQRMAECCGMAYLDHTSHLSMHPTYGPWFSLRCCVVVDGVRWEAPPPPALPCPLTPAQHANVRAAAGAAFGRMDDEGSTLPEMADVRAGWELWLAVRIAAAPGHPHKYSQQQILYHYTGNRDILKAAAAAAARASLNTTAAAQN